MALNLSAEIVKGRNHTRGITTIIALQLRHPALELTRARPLQPPFKGAPRELGGAVTNGVMVALARYEIRLSNLE